MVKSDQVARPDDAPEVSPFSRVCSVLAFLGLGGVMLFVVHLATQPLRYGDHFWQVRTGEMILQTGSIPGTDPFSYTVHGVLWNNHQWGYEALAALLYRGLGWFGFRLAILVLVGGCAVGLFRWVQRRCGAPLGLLLTALFVQLAYYKFNPACQTLIMGVFFLSYAMLLRDRTFTDKRWSIALIVVLLIWGNLSAEALIFLPVVVADQGLHWLGGKPANFPDETARQRRLRVLVVILACTVPMLNPPSSSVLNYVLEGSAVNQSVNTEFTHMWDAAGTLPLFTQWLARVLAVGFVLFLALRVGLSNRRLWTLRRLVPGLLCVVAAVYYERYYYLLALPLGLILVEAFAARRRAWVDAAALVLAVTLTVPFLRAVEWTPAIMADQLTDGGYWETDLDPQHLPLACTDFINTHHPEANLATFRHWGGYVIWAMPGTKVFIDGRNREYPIELHDAEAELWARTPRAAAILDATETDVVLTWPVWAEHPTLRHWQEVYTGGNCAVFARR